MKIQINRRMQVLHTYEGLSLLQYRVKSLFGNYIWKTVAVIVVEAEMNFKDEIELLQLLRIVKKELRRKRIETETVNNIMMYG